MSTELAPISPVGNYATNRTPKRAKHTLEDQPGYCQITANNPGVHPGAFWAISPGLDRFGADCLRWLAVRRNFDGGFESFQKLVNTCNNKMKERVPFEGLRLLLPFIVPVLVFFLGMALFGEYYRQRSFGGFSITISEQLVRSEVSSKLLLILAVSLLAGQWLHRNITKAIAQTIPAEAILITTYMTRHNITMEDIKKKPGLIEGAIHASACVSRAMQDQMLRMARNSMGEQSRKIEKFLLPSQNGQSYAPLWQDLISIYNNYINVYQRGNRSAGYFDSSSDSSYAGSNYSAFPQFNTNGMPMIEGTGVDVTGHVYASPDNF